MTESDLRLIETKLFIALPEQYRRIMLGNPLARYVEPPEACIPITSLITDPLLVIEANYQLRRKKSLVPLPPTYLCFAEEIWEDGWTDYFLDLAVESSPVYLMSTEQEGGEHYEIYLPTLADWIEDEAIKMEEAETALKEEAEWRVAQQRAEERKRNKKWWQFWI